MYVLSCHVALCSRRQLHQSYMQSRQYVDSRGRADSAVAVPGGQHPECHCQGHYPPMSERDCLRGKLDYSTAPVCASQLGYDARSGGHCRLWLHTTARTDALCDCDFVSNLTEISAEEHPEKPCITELYCTSITPIALCL